MVAVSFQTQAYVASMSLKASSRMASSCWVPSVSESKERVERVRAGRMGLRRTSGGAGICGEPGAATGWALSVAPPLPPPPAAAPGSTAAVDAAVALPVVLVLAAAAGVGTAAVAGICAPSVGGTGDAVPAADTPAPAPAPAPAPPPAPAVVVLAGTRGGVMNPALPSPPCPRRLACKSRSSSLWVDCSCQ